MSREIRVVLAGGASGGHTFPLIAVARALKLNARDPVRLLFVGSRGTFETMATETEGIPARYIVAGKWRRYFSILNYIDLFKLPIGFVQSLWHLYSFMPDAVFAKGAASSVPVGLAAWILRIPLVIHDSDAVAGRANRFLSTFAARVGIAYPTAKQYFPQHRTSLVGNPVRDGILHGDADRARARYGFTAQRPVVLVIGGSLGARSLNLAIARVLPNLLRESYVIHQTGMSNVAEAAHFASEFGVKAGHDGYATTPFLSEEELADAYALSSVVVSRAGASSIAEIAALGKPSILVPLETAANDEQRANAYEVARIGGAIVLEEANLGEHLLGQKLEELVKSHDLRRRMSEQVRVFYNPEAAKDIALGIIELSS